MHEETILFQLATHYLPKNALRLECLFHTLDEACIDTHPIIHHYALNNIFEIIKLTDKPELKSRFLKELIRITHVLQKSSALSDPLYARIYAQIQVLSHLAGRFCDSIRQDHFLQSVKLAQASHFHEGELYSPQLLLWLESHADYRQANLIQWREQLQTLHDTVSIYLTMLRSATYFEVITMEQGFYQRSLSSQNTCQLILLRMTKHKGIVPKMQFGHHGLSIRLCDAKTMRELHQTQTDVELAICQL